jgi:pyridoxal phosphate enzyme (YggS family)
VETIAQRRTRVLERIAGAAAAAGRRAEEITLVAVSKTVDADAVRAAWAAGQRLFGENRAQELRAKSRLLSDLPIEWHFVGSLQTNKVRLVLPLATLIHSVDRAELAEQIARRLPPGATYPILVQVNTSREASKSGVSPEALPALLDRIAGLPRLRVEGLMTIGPLTEDAEATRAAFALLRRLRDAERARGRVGAPLTDLSMGMSGDLELAIAEGATIVRVGTDLFGPRPV